MKKSLLAESLTLAIKDSCLFLQENSNLFDCPDEEPWLLVKTFYQSSDPQIVMIGILLNWIISSEKISFLLSQNMFLYLIWNDKNVARNDLIVDTAFRRNIKASFRRLIDSRVVIEIAPPRWDKKALAGIYQIAYPDIINHLKWFSYDKAKEDLVRYKEQRHLDF